jgi:hypothetical protein
MVNSLQKNFPSYTRSEWILSKFRSYYSAPDGDKERVAVI